MKKISLAFLLSLLITAVVVMFIVVLALTAKYNPYLALGISILVLVLSITGVLYSGGFIK